MPTGTVRRTCSSYCHPVDRERGLGGRLVGPWQIGAFHRCFIGRLPPPWPGAKHQPLQRIDRHHEHHLDMRGAGIDGAGVPVDVERDPYVEPAVETPYRFLRAVVEMAQRAVAVQYEPDRKCALVVTDLDVELA